MEHQRRFFQCGSYHERKGWQVRERFGWQLQELWKCRVQSIFSFQLIYVAIPNNATRTAQRSHRLHQLSLVGIVVYVERASKCPLHSSPLPMPVLKLAKHCPVHHLLPPRLQESKDYLHRQSRRKSNQKLSPHRPSVANLAIAQIWSGYAKHAATLYEQQTMITREAGDGEAGTPHT